ncbi:hypothetical protein PHLCEN_2v11039 [Hermanssonia centrifuga]|uniref:Uncharacterized protein n=1 Tax=Hermanssonia centrifuga TaxID=98765 RepID=A0A2R6NM47_9APHY|nr:hypothetical protein PHLCEN_2v11039 [Hermanssonia centrifuga]
MPSRQCIVFLVSLILLSGQACAALVNVTVDDQSPDPPPGVTLIYSPIDDWNTGPSCTTCVERPVDAFEGTWHDTTYNPADAAQSTMATATFQFTGTLYELIATYRNQHDGLDPGSAIYAFGILSHSSVNDFREENLLFYLDGEPCGAYEQSPVRGDPAYSYNINLYANDSIPHGPHNFTIQNGQQAGSSSLILLDYYVYSMDDEAPSSSDGTSTVIVTQAPSTFSYTSEVQPSMLSSPPTIASSSLRATTSTSSLPGIPITSSSSIVLITGSPSAGAPMIAPSSPAPLAHPTGNNLSPSASSSLTESSHSVSPHTRAVIIACTVCGGVILLALIFFCCRRHLRSRLDKHMLFEINQFVLPVERPGTPSQLTTPLAYTQSLPDVGDDDVFSSASTNGTTSVAHFPSSSGPDAMSLPPAYKRSAWEGEITLKSSLA